MDDIRTTKNIRLKSTGDLMKEYKQKEKEQKDISKAHKEALVEEKRREHIKSLKEKQARQKARYQEKLEVQKQKAEIKRLKEETSFYGKAKSIYAKMKQKQKEIQCKRQPIKQATSKKRMKKEQPIYFIKGVPYHYRNGKLVEVKIAKPKKKKKKETITI